MVSHDLRNPLSVVAMAAGSLRRFDDDRVRNAARRIDRQVGVMTRLLDELVDVARLQAGERLELARAPMDLVVLARQLFAEYAPDGDLALLAESMVGNWDERRIERLVSNLLSNAHKYGRGAVSLRLEQDGGFALLSVSDRGIGIPEQELESIFQWYTRGTNAGLGKGTGIGLPSARSIAEQHGGRLEVESVLGAGSTFRLRLPLAG